MSVRVVLVHGLWHGAWSWDAVRDELAEAGVDAVAVDLPLTSVADDVATVRRALDAAAGPTVLVGHSYGGAVITTAGVHPSVRRLVYLAAFALAEGESISRVAPEHAIGATGLATALTFSADGQLVGIDPEQAPQLLYGQLSDEVRAQVVTRLRPVARSLFSTRAEHAAWRDVPATYAVCTEDRCVAPDLQRVMAQRVTEQLEWASDHSVPLSHPQLVADLLIRLARQVQRAAPPRQG